MRYKKLDLNLLVALDALLRERNVTRAAEGLNLTQSAMSNALARLREYFDDELLIQTGRQFLLTPLAETIAEPVRRMLLTADLIIDVRPDFRPEASSRRFKILSSDYTREILIPKLISRAFDQSKTIGFDLIDQTEHPEILLERGDVDLMFIPERYAAKNHPWEAVFEDSYVCVCWSGNKLIRDSISFDEYFSFSHVVVSHGRDRIPAFDEWFLQKLGAVRNIGVTTSSLVAPCSLVVGTERIATVHAKLAKQMKDVLPLKILTLPFEAPKLIQGLQWHQARSTEPGLMWLKEQVTIVASE